MFNKTKSIHLHFGLVFTHIHTTLNGSLIISENYIKVMVYPQNNFVGTNFNVYKQP